MVNRKKRLKKSIESLEKRRIEHLAKIEEEKKKQNYNYALVEYWGKEVESLTLVKKEKERLLKNL